VQQKNLPIEASFRSGSLLASQQHSSWCKWVDIGSRWSVQVVFFIYRRKHSIKLFFEIIENGEKINTMLGVQFLPVDFAELMLNRVLILFLGAGVARTGVIIAELFSRRVLGVAGESNNLRARTPL
jgi:hypothetical protein